MDSHTIISRAESKAQGLKRYFTGDPCVHGHVAERFSGGGACVECDRIRSSAHYKKNSEKIKARSKQWAAENADAKKAYDTAYYQANSEKLKQRTRDWGIKNPKLKQARNDAWNAANPEKARTHQREYEKRRLASDPMFALRARMQSAIRGSLIKGGYTKRSRTHEYLGCSFDEFKRHIEKQFLKGMTWENRRLWHLDHLRPVSSAKTEEELIAIHHFTNLRPLWAKDNLAKGDNMEFLI